MQAVLIDFFLKSKYPSMQSFSATKQFKFPLIARHIGSVKKIKLILSCM